MRGTLRLRLRLLLLLVFVPLGLLGERRVQGEVEKSRGGEGEAR